MWYQIGELLNQVLIKTKRRKLFPGNGGEERVRKWKEVKLSRKMEGVEKGNISAVVKIIKDEVNLTEGADKFGEILERMCNESTSSGTSSKLIGDLDDDTMIFAIFHCIRPAGNDDKINIAYVINTLSTELPREDTRLNIAAVKDFAHPDLTEELDW